MRYLKIIIAFLSILVLQSCSIKLASEIQETELAKEEYIEFINLHNDFLIELSHCLSLVHIIINNQDKSLSAQRGVQLKVINSYITFDELGPDIFDNQNISAVGNKMTPKSLAENIMYSRLFDNSSEFAYLLKSIMFSSDSLNLFATKIDNLLQNEDTSGNTNQIKVDKLLDKSVSAFKSIADYHLLLNEYITVSNEFSKDEKRLEFHFSNWHSTVLQISQALMQEEPQRVVMLLKQLEELISVFKVESFELDKDQLVWISEAISLIKALMNSINDKYLNPIDVEYYAVGHIQYKHIVLNYINSIKPGYVSKLNNIIARQYDSYIRYADFPIYLKRVDLTTN